MARTKLEKLLTEEVNHYLGIPYAKNYWKNNLLIKEAILGGKGTWPEIDYATTCAGEKYQVDITSLSPKELYNFQKKHKIGIDCSGLVYHLLDFIDKNIGANGILFKVVSVNPNHGKYGVRSLSADSLTNSINSYPITNYSHVQLGDLIRHHQGKHTLLITGQKNNRLNYVHSSLTTLVSGVHTGYIKIIDPQKPLFYQDWTDVTKNHQKYQELSDSKAGDGIYRLNCWKNITFPL
ncbi:MAG: hypothetical protein WCV93_02665 [Candidatus Shapirobacteria bacterium]|jgi:hypothetical protein